MERETLFDRGGEMALRMAALDWAGTALGPPAQWPHSLRAVVRVMLTSRYAMWMAWGPSLTFFCNDAYLPTLGVKQEWALGSPANEVWAEIWPDIGPRIDRVLQTGEATWDEALRLILKRSGYSEETYHTFSYSPLADDAGRVSGMLCVVTEETERVIGERRLGALRDLAARLAASSGEAEVCRAISLSLAGASHDLPFAAVYLADADGAYRLVAQAGLPTMHGAFPEVVHAGDAPWPLDDVMRTGGSPRSIDDLASRWPDLPSGPWPEPPSRAVLLPIPQQGKARPAGVFIAAVNPFRPLDEAYGSFLGLVAGQISASLSNARAYEAERQRAEALAEIDRAKTTFFSNVSHEFRTPLTLMLGPLLDTITQHNGSLPPQVMEELTVVHRNGLRLLKLVNTLLDFSRIEAGRVQVSFEWTDLAGYTRDLASLFRSAIEKAGLTLEVDIPTVATPARVDRDMWEKIVLNLISNAFKFTLRGGIRVSLREVRDAFVLMVQDTGCGISAEELPRVFDRFHRVAGTQGRTHEGTGIGLALVQELVKMHEGSVAAESEPGRGSTFYVTIPRRSEQAAPPLPAGEAIPERSARSNAYVEEALRWLPDGELPASESLDDATGIEESRPAGAARDVVLIADDNADMRDYLRRLLAKRYDVITVADGAEALREAVSRRPALILSDVMMPKLDGFGLLQAVRAEPALSSVSILLLSARAGEEATLEGIRAGADDYLVKPFSARELLTRVEAQIQRKRFEAQLAAAERTLRSTLAAAQMAAWTWDPQTDDVSLSETAAEVFGLQPGQSIRTGSDGLSLLLPQDIARHQMIVDRAIEQNDAFTSEFRIVRPLDGKIAWLEQRGQVFRDASTGQLHVTGLIADVTQRKLAELALQASKERANFFVTLDDALRSITDPSEMSWEAAHTLAEYLQCDRALYVEVDEAAEYCVVAGEFTRGLSSVRGRYRIRDYGEAYYQTVLMNRPYVLDDTTQPSVAPAERERYAKLSIGAFIAAPLFKSGRLVAMFVVHQARPRTWSGGEVETVSLVASRCWESIERTRVARELRASEERLAFAVEAAELGTFYCPLSTKQIIWNEKCCEHFFVSPDTEVDFDLFFSLVHPEDREATRAAVARAINDKEPYDTEYRVLAADGRVRWIRAKGRAYLDAAGKPTRFDGVTLDITLRKADDQRREELFRAERAAREEAERISRMKDEFLATLSHELRTPLNAILGWSQILTHRSADADDLRQGLETIRRNAAAQTQIIEDLLDMSRIISGKVRLEMQHVDLRSVVRQAIDSVRPALDAKGIRLHADIGSGEAMVSGDAGRLQQVVWNLLSNAVKFTPKDGRIDVAMKQDAVDVELLVRDTGVGIAADFLPHVFERFRQADSSTTRQHGGLGLGLSIVKQLAELHGGAVRAESEGANRGSTFILTLPLLTPMHAVTSEREPVDVPHPLGDATAARTTAAPDLRGVDIVVVDDDQDSRDLVVRILRDHGASVVAADSVRQALDILRRVPPSLLISDIGMPEEDGYDLIRRVRAFPTRPLRDVPAIALTAFARMEDRLKTLDAGYQLHLTKPIEAKELIEACATLLQWNR